jgi:hypothetical protein
VLNISKFEYEYNLIRLGYELGVKNKGKNYIDPIAFNTLIAIKKACKKLHKYCEAYCDKADFKYELIEKQQKRINFLVGELPIWINLKVVEFQNDPRGSEVKFNNGWVSNWIYGGC